MFVDKSSIVVRNQFTNKKSSNSGNVKNFIMNYMLRPDAVEPLMVDSKQQNDYLNSLSQYDKVLDDMSLLDEINKKLSYEGVGFSLNEISLSRAESNVLADECQQAYDRGATVKQMVISFDTQYLKDNGILDSTVEEPIRRGALRNNVDQYKLRKSVMDGMESMLDQTTMHDPQMVAAIQTDTAHVHVHISVWDNDPKVKDDRGKINEKQKDALRNSLDYSLKYVPDLVKESNDLVNVHDTVKDNSKFKLELLEKQLYDTALRLDTPSMHQYINNLADFDGRTLSVRQRETLSDKIISDFARNGRHTYRSHTVSRGQRRGRRQIAGMKKAIGLRNELNSFNQAMSWGNVAKEAFAVKDAMMYEYEHNLRIIEKYRMYQRPRVDALYQTHANDLDFRFGQLQAKRTELYTQLDVRPINQVFVRDLLRNEHVMDAIREDMGQSDVSQSKVLSELRSLERDGTFPLSDKTINVVKFGLKDDKSEDELDQIDKKLRSNQQVRVESMSRSQKMLFYEYLSELEEYERDSCTWGGRSSLKLSGNLDIYQHGGVIPEPVRANSIYERFDISKNSDVLAVDVHDVLDSAKLKPSVELSYRKQLGVRAKKLLKANDYFVNTGQVVPKWLISAQKDLNDQFKVLNNCTGSNIKTDIFKDKVLDTEGFDIPKNFHKKLVQKHLEDLNNLAL